MALDINEWKAERKAKEEVRRTADSFRMHEPLIPRPDAEIAAEEAELNRRNFYKVDGDKLHWIFAGDATFTVRNARTGNRFTYVVSAHKENPDFYWVAVLTGPDNTVNYTSLGRIVRGEYSRNFKSRISADAASAKVFEWFYRHLKAGTLPDFIEVWHAARCCKCGRLLTVDESIKRGYGPECAAMLGF